MAEILGSLIALAILFGFCYLISLLFKSKLRKAQKWAALKSWAKAQGYELPKKANPFMTFIGVMGLLAYVLPGLFVLYFCWRKDQEYEKEMRALMNKWIDAGKPLPPAKK